MGHSLRWRTDYMPTRFASCETVKVSAQRGVFWRSRRSLMEPRSRDVSQDRRDDRTDAAGLG